MIEQMPTGGEMPEEKGNQEKSFEYEVALAQALLNAINERNDFVHRQGGFDTFAEAGQYTPGMKEAYDQMEKAVGDAREAFDTGVSDKAAVVEQMKKTDEMGAKTIALMFGLEKPNKNVGSAIRRFFKGQ